MLSIALAANAEHSLQLKEVREVAQGCSRLAPTLRTQGLPESCCFAACTRPLFDWVLRSDSMRLSSGHKKVGNRWGKEDAPKVVLLLEAHVQDAAGWTVGDAVAANLLEPCFGRRASDAGSESLEVLDIGGSCAPTLHAVVMWACKSPASKHTI